MKRLALLFGLSAGAIIIVTVFLIFAVYGGFENVTPKDLPTLSLLGYSRYLILFLAIGMAMAALRRKEAGPISYGSMLGLGVLTAAAAALCVGAMEAVYVATHPEFYDQYYAVAAESERLAGGSAEAIAALAEQRESLRWVESPAATGAFYLVETFVVGSIFSLIAALAARRKAGVATAEGSGALNSAT